MSFTRRSWAPVCVGALLVGFGLVCATPAHAWEGVYGATADTDNGARGVTPVQYCPGGGFISTGTRAAGAASDVYVVRTNAAGGVIFERRYDVGLGRRDQGNSIVELRAAPGGFAIAGNSALAGGTNDALLIRIDCNGNLVWSFTYGTSQDDSAADLVEATSGNPAGFGTNAGDIVVAGLTTNPAAANTDGLLFRVRPNGTLIWSRRYDVNNVTEAFASLTEARPSLASPTGDIAIAGSWRAGGAPDQGYALRVSGDTGLIGGGATCAAIYGGPDADRFTAVVESRVGATSGQLLFSGTSFSTVQANDIYVVRAQPNPCGVIVQRRIGFPLGNPLGDESPADLRQITAPLPFGPVGSLALTGSVGQFGSNAYEAFLLPVNENSLLPGLARRFGDHATRRDVGTSLFQIPSTATPGFIIAGTSDSDFQGVGDPQDLYLARTDGAGATNCSIPFDLPNVTVAFPPTAVNPVTPPVLQAQQQQTTIVAQNTTYISCP